MLGTKSLDYYKYAQITDVKSFIILGPGPITGAGASIDPLLNATDYRGRKREEGGGAKEVNKIGKSLHLALDVAILEGGALMIFKFGHFVRDVTILTMSHPVSTSSIGRHDTFGITTFSITTLSIMTFSIMIES